MMHGKVAIAWHGPRCRWHRCRRPYVARRATSRYGSATCRSAAHRAPKYAERLRACKVEQIPRHEARAFILKYEHLGTVGGAKIFYGLRSPAGQLLSIVGFERGPHAGGDGACMVLERGATRRRAPRNAASYLISRALGMGGWQTVKAYSDPRFGERGLVYKASGFKRCQPTKHGTWGWRYGLAVGNKVLSDRAIRRRYGSHEGARQTGATIVRLPERVAWEWRA